jgi:hypothetical protein
MASVTTTTSVPRHRGEPAPRWWRALVAPAQAEARASQPVAASAGASGVGHVRSA